MPAHERTGGPTERTQQPAVERITPACEQAQGITKVAKTFHNNPAINRPEPSASKTRKTNEGSGGRWENMTRQREGFSAEGKRRACLAAAIKPSASLH